jgi:hypothetical protein
MLPPNLGARAASTTGRVNHLQNLIGTECHENKESQESKLPQRVPPADTPVNPRPGILQAPEDTCSEEQLGAAHLVHVVRDTKPRQQAKTDFQGGRPLSTLTLCGPPPRVSMT